MQRIPLERFRDFYTVDPGGCWLWHGGLLDSGYGRFWLENNAHYRAHRFSYEAHVGKIPRGKFVLHSCDVRVCVNPAHLRLGTKKDNYLDQQKRNRVALGERHGRSKLSDAQVLQALSMRGTKSQAEIATLFNVTQGQISRIFSGELRRSACIASP